MNADGAPSPRAQQGRSRSWAPSSVREVLHRALYRGEIVWTQTHKRNSWGQKHQSARPEADWIRRAGAGTPDRAGGRLGRCACAARRALAASTWQSTSGRPFGRPALGNPSKYLLTNLALCGCCGGPLKVVLAAARDGRASSSTAVPGTTNAAGRVCTNNADVPMTDADDIVIEALLDDVLDQPMIEDAVDEALASAAADDGAGERVDQVEAEIAKVDREQARLVAAIAAGGELAGLVEAAQGARSARGRGSRLTARPFALSAALEAADARRVRDELLSAGRTRGAACWSTIQTNARPIVSSLLIGRVTITPLAKRKRWELTRRGHVDGSVSAGDLIPRDGVPSGIRTRVLALKGPRPGPLDDGDSRRESKIITRAGKTGSE